jgi:hypothetical protein
MATARRAGRRPGKSDPIDAEAVAIAALRHPDLPVTELEGRPVRSSCSAITGGIWSGNAPASPARSAGTGTIWTRIWSCPLSCSKGLRSQCVVDELTAALGKYDGVVARLAVSLLVRCRELNEQINALDRELRDLMPWLAPSLLQVPGCGVVSAAVIVGETAGVHRFRSKDAFARFTGTVPVPVWSGSSAGKVRLNRGGNRAMNHALHMIAITQARGIGPGRGNLDKQMARGKDKTAALRLLRRQLSDAVFSALRADQLRMPIKPSTGSTQHSVQGGFPTAEEIAEALLDQLVRPPGWLPVQ